MADSPLRGSNNPVTSFGLGYGPAGRVAITWDVLVRTTLFVVWLVLFAAGLVYVNRYALTNPFVDEWAFVPVLLSEEWSNPPRDREVAERGLISASDPLQCIIMGASVTRKPPRTARNSQCRRSQVHTFRTTMIRLGKDRDTRMQGRKRGPIDF